MNTRRFAGALERVANAVVELWEGGSNQVAVAKITNELRAAAAACEEEGEGAGRVLREHAQRLDTHRARIAEVEKLEFRIAALEEKLNNPLNVGAPYWEQPTAPGRPARPPAPEVQKCGECGRPESWEPQPPAPEERCFHGVPGTACRACNGPAPPEQAQETKVIWAEKAIEGRCNFVNYDGETCIGRHDPSRHYSKPSPEQAQETDAPLKMTPHPRETCRALDPPCVSCAPEQARRTWEGHVGRERWVAVERHFYDNCDGCENGAERITVTDLRPGERIVSGEGVRVHRYAYDGGIFQCTLDPCAINPANVVHGVAYFPAAPPRAEEK